MHVFAFKRWTLSYNNHKNIRRRLNDFDWKHVPILLLACVVYMNKSLALNSNHRVAIASSSIIL